MANLAREATGQENPTVLADRGYYKGEEIVECERQGITALVPKPITSNSAAEGRFDKRDFVYIPEDNEYRCPAGKAASNNYGQLGLLVRLQHDAVLAVVDTEQNVLATEPAV